MTDTQTKEQGTQVLCDQEPTNLPAVKPARAARKNPETRLNVPPISPLEMIQSAIERGASLDQIDRLISLKERMEADEARKAFIAAKVAFKAEGFVVIKDRFNAQYGSQYASLGQLVNTVGPFLSKHNLSADWELDQSSGLEVTCVLSHSMGHRERVALKVPNDTSGAKNALQQIKSSVSYARSITFEAACGLASTDASDSDDGNGSGEPINRNAVAEASAASRQKNDKAPPAGLLAIANETAEGGTAKFGPWWKSITQEQRTALLPNLDALQKKAAAVTAGRN